MFERFVFVGYLIQEPYWRTWPGREGFRVASIEREYHPVLNKFQWNNVEGVENPTVFLTTCPRLDALKLEPHKCKSKLHRQSPGWVINGYALPYDFVQITKLTSVDRTTALLEFSYALRMKREDDGLILLGYEVIDEEDSFLSILNNCGYSVEQVGQMAGPLNEYSLFSSCSHAQRFVEAIKTDPENPGIIPDHNRGVVIEVWGNP